jgi:hypothetical protein
MEDVLNLSPQARSLVLAEALERACELAGLPIKQPTVSRIAE